MNKIKDQIPREKVEGFLHSLGFHNIIQRDNSFRFGWDKEANPNGIVLYKDELTFKYWSKNLYGDIIDLTKERLDVTLGEAFKYVENYFSISPNRINIKEYENPYSRIIGRLKDNEYELFTPCYEKDSLNSYEKCYSELLSNDGISRCAQYIFDIRYADEENRICFPVLDWDGRLVGMIGRYNKRDIPNKIPKYFPLLRYDKGKVLYGLFQNKKRLLRGTIIIVESEKSVLKAATLGYYNVVALGGNSLSKVQLSLLFKLLPKRIILALDEDMSEKHIEEQIKRISERNGFFKAEVGVVKKDFLGTKNCVFDEESKMVDIILKDIDWRKG